MKGITVPSQRLTPKEVADILGLSVITVWGYARNGKIKAYKDNKGKLFFMRDDIEEFKARSETLAEVVPVVSETAQISGKDVGMKNIKGYMMTVAEVAAFLRTSKSWINMHMNDGTFPIRWYPVGPRERVMDSADVEEWLLKIYVSAGTAPLPLKSVKKIKKIKEAAMK